MSHLTARILENQNAARLPNSRGVERTRVELAAFPKDGVYRFAISLLGEDQRRLQIKDLRFRNPFSRGFWSRSWIPIELEIDRQREVVLLDVVSTARRLNVSPEVIRQLHSDQQLVGYLRDQGLQRSVPALKKEEIDRIREGRPAHPESMISRISMNNNSILAVIPEWRFLRKTAEKIQRVWNYTKGGFSQADDATQSVAEYFSKLSVGQAPSVLDCKKKRGLTSEDIKEINEQIRKRYGEIYDQVIKDKEAKTFEINLPSGFSCRVKIQRDSSVQVHWKGYIFEVGSRAEIVDYEWEFLTGTRNSKYSDGTYKEKVSRYFLERTNQIKRLFKLHAPQLGINEITTARILDLIFDEHPKYLKQDRYAGGMKIRFFENGGIEVEAPHKKHITFDAATKLPVICKGCAQYWDFLAGEYSTTTEPFFKQNQHIVQGNLQQGWMDLRDAEIVNDYLTAHYEEVMAKVLKDGVPVTIRGQDVNPRLPCNLYFKVDGFVYAKIKGKRYPAGATKKAKDGIDVFRSMRVKRLVANLKDNLTAEQKQAIESLRREFQILSLFKGCRGIVEVCELVEGKNKRNEPILTLIERNYRLGELTNIVGLTLEQKWAVAEDILYGIREIHQKKYLHRDLKPGNILVDTPNIEFTPKSKVIGAIADFNISIKVENDNQEISLAGTPTFFSPEKARQWSGLESGWTAHLERMSEMWSVGVVLYELFINAGLFRQMNLTKLSNLSNQELFFPAPKKKGSIEYFIYRLLRINQFDRLTSEKALAEFLKLKSELNSFWNKINLQATPLPSSSASQIVFTHGKTTEPTTYSSGMGSLKITDSYFGSP